MATSNKYDRQLRLWGAAGQQALAETVVVLLNPTAAGTETLKNLVLPGLGKFVVVDEAEAAVTAEDVAANFFLPSLGKPRAATAATCLQELNPDVHGSWFVSRRPPLPDEYFFVEQLGYLSTDVGEFEHSINATHHDVDNRRHLSTYKKLGSMLSFCNAWCCNLQPLDYFCQIRRLRRLYYHWH